MPSSTRRAYAAWIVVCVVWSTTYLGIRVAIETIPPFVMSALRWIPAGALILAALKARGERLPPPAEWGSLAVLGFLLIAVANGALAWSELTIPSGLAALLVTTTPFWIVGVDAMMPGGEPLTLRTIAGLAIGFAGILFLVGPDLQMGSGSGFLAGVIVSQIGCAAWAVGSAYARRRRVEENVLGAAAFEMLFGGIFLLAAGTLHGEWSMLTFTTRTVAAYVYLTLVGSIAAFSAYLYALKHLPVSFVSLYAYINPVIAVVLGTLLLKEPFSGRTAVAGGVVLAGMSLVRRGTPAQS
jgi:drug/metabolite transporter (DMT)-like permease